MRRGFGRGMGRGMGQGGRPNVPPRLRKAHELMAAGNFAAAADAFEELAHAGEARQHPRTGQMYLQAGRARLMAGQKAEGVESIKKGLGVMHSMGRKGQLARIGDRVVQELNQHGLTAEANVVAEWLKKNAPATSIGTAPLSKKAVLPTNCPGCGGPVRADDIEWIDDVTAECNWCGSPLRAEG